MGGTLIQPAVMLSALVGGFAAGAGAFAALWFARLCGVEPHPATAHTWTMLWVALAFTAVLSVVGIDVFVGGPGDGLYVLIVAGGTAAGYALGASAVGRPWLVLFDAE